MAQTVLILGAAGRVGLAVAQAFLDAGFRVKAATRNGRAVMSGTEPVAVDAMDTAQLRTAIAGVDVVFNGLNPPYTEWKSAAMPMARNVMHAMRGSGALHLFPGNVYSFGSPMPNVLREETPQRPTANKGKIRVEMEELFAREAREHGTRTIILRAGDFFGGGPGSWFDLALTSRIKSGVFVAPAAMNLPHAWAYLPDLAATFAKLPAISSQLAPFETLHFPGHTVTLADMKSGIEKALGRPLKTSTLPWWALRLTTPFSAMNREILEMRYLWDEEHRLVSDKLQQLVGPVPHTPLNEAIARAIGQTPFQAAA